MTKFGLIANTAPSLSPAYKIVTPMARLLKSAAVATTKVAVLMRLGLKENLTTLPPEQPTNTETVEVTSGDATGDVGLPQEATPFG